MTAATEAAWRRACLVAELTALDPSLGGTCVRAAAGPVRDAWLDHLRRSLPDSAPMRRVPLGVTDDRLLGGIDLPATLRMGRPIAQSGLMAEAKAGVLILAMAERLTTATAARITTVLDNGEVSAEREGFSFRTPTQFACIAFDEGHEDGERPPAALLDRLAFWIDLHDISASDLRLTRLPRRDLEGAAAALPSVESTQADVEALITAALQLGIRSLRSVSLALRTARVACALRGDTQVSDSDLQLAAMLVLAPRATQLPQSASTPKQDEAKAEEPQQAPDSSDQSDDSDSDSVPDLTDIVLAAAAAVMPQGLLDQIKAGLFDRGRSPNAGKSGSEATGARRGRPLGPRPGALRNGRLGLIETLRTAAPWQPVRRRHLENPETRRLIIHPDDFRIRRYRERRETSAIFVVDASGSSAMHRLAEVKGAIELLLGECYSRRDNVALVSFRDRAGEIVLPPTRSLVRAKRLLAGLPGGGGTPIASGIEMALTLADSVRRKGQSPLLILMTDGQANIGRDGSPGRARAFEDALAAGRKVRAAGVSAIAIDTSRPGPSKAMSPTRQLSEAMNARYLKLPYADAAHVSEIVRAATISA